MLNPVLLKNILCALLNRKTVSTYYGIFCLFVFVFYFSIILVIIIIMFIFVMFHVCLLFLSIFVKSYVFYYVYW